MNLDPDEFESDAVGSTTRTPVGAGSRLAPGHGRAPARRGRPPEMSADQVLVRIVELAERGALYRVHFRDPALYARARRHFGSWAGALGRAGLDHARAIAEARRRSLEARRSAGEPPPASGRVRRRTLPATL